MPDFFDRLIARGGPPGQTSEVAFALPRLPGPFERPTARPPDAFIETIEETRDVGPAPTAPPIPRSVPGVLSGPRSSPPPLAPDGITTRAPAVPGEPPPVRPAPARQPPPLPMATPEFPGPDAGITVAAKDQPSDRASRPSAESVRVTTAGQPEHGSPEPPPALPRTLAVPATAVHSVQAADDAGGAQAQSPEPPVVTVRIGRIEVRDTSQDRRERPAKQRARRPAPKLTLAAYLAAADAGQNTGGAR
jgi:hypothetical protein